MNRGSFRFDEFELDLAARELRGADGPIDVERQVFDVLAYLVDHHDRVVPKTELFDEIWGDRFVSESALSSRIKSARKAIGDDGDRQRLIRTTRGVGFRFVGAVERVTVEEVDSEHRATATAIAEPVDALIGRDDEIAQLTASVGTHRLITLIGPGGIGKTHLMRHAGARIATDFVDGARLVDLTTIADAAAVASTVARQLGAVQYADSTVEESVLRSLGQRHLLLLIDNAEHVRAAVAQLCSAILAACPNVTLMITSRERLGIDGEWLLPLGPLSIASSVELFTQRAAAHAVDIDQDAGELSALCARLDGMPLAIQLAASRTRMLSLTDIAERLGDHLSTDTLDSDNRHANMERAIAWSFESLDAAERGALGALSVLRGAFTVDDAAAVVGGDALNLVVRLVERSLVAPVPGPDSRFRMLEPIRLFAAAGHRDAAATARYVARFVDAAEAADARIDSGDIDGGAADLRRNWPNVRGAFEEAVARGDVDSARRLTVATETFAEFWLQIEVAEWALTVAGADGEPTSGAVTRVDLDAIDPDAEMLAIAARLLAHTGARDRAGAIVAALETAAPIPAVVQARLWDCWYRGDIAGLVEQLDLLESQLDESRGPVALAVRTMQLFAASLAGTPDTAISAALRSLALRSGDTGHAFVWFADGVEAFWEQRFEDAIGSFDRGVEAAAEGGLMLFASGVASFRSIAVASMIHDDHVIERLTTTLGAAVETGERAVVVGDLAVMTDLTVAAFALAVRGERTTAARLLGLRHASEYHSRTSEWIAEMTAALLVEDDREHFDREFDARTKLDLKAAVRMALDALQALKDQTLGADSASGEKRPGAAAP